MENYNDNLEYQNQTKTLANSFVANVFMWMFVALGITALTAYLFGTSEELFRMLISVKPNGSVTMSILGWIVMLSPFLIILVMSFGAEKMSASTMVILYVAYSVLMGMSLSFIFLAFTSASIFKTFIITAGMFGIMAVVGYTTKTDLSSMGKILFMALIGLIIATVVNLFLRNDALMMILSYIGVIIFIGLTAWDSQKIKLMLMQAPDAGETAQKMALLGALTLYLDFVNLFIYLLRIFGRRR